MTRFGEKVRDQRELLKLSQEQLANMVGVSRRTIITYEAGSATPRQKTLKKIAEALGVTQRYLTTDTSDDPQDGIDQEPVIEAAREKYGKKGAEEMANVLMKNEALFAGGTLSEDQKDMFYEAITKAYFANKQHAREKFGRKEK